MTLEPLLIVELALLGLGTGFLAGLLGIGGGMLMVPFITSSCRRAAWARPGRQDGHCHLHGHHHLHLHLQRARPPQARRGALGHRQAAGARHRDGQLVGSLGVFALLKGSYLAIFFGLFVGFSATQMLDKKPKPTRQMPGTGGQLAAGGVIGFLSGLVGAGGGFISVPFMTWCNVAIHNAVATSAALGFPIGSRPGGFLGTHQDGRVHCPRRHRWRCRPDGAIYPGHRHQEQTAQVVLHGGGQQGRAARVPKASWTSRTVKVIHTRS
jgi:hypothetical protein